MLEWLTRSGLWPRTPANDVAPVAEPDTIAAREALLVTLREAEGAADAELRAASARTRAAPMDAKAAAEHLACADRLSAIARKREKLEMALLDARHALGPR